MGVALQQVIPSMINRKVMKNSQTSDWSCLKQCTVKFQITGYFELIKPLVEFKYEEVLQRNNTMFELATTEEIDKLQNNKKSSSGEVGKFSDVISLGEVTKNIRFQKS